ncbi:MAG: serine/threonine-protein kinase [Leptolyngbyaceae cyanobacterium bins.349]|nr:serine/threonine-protein kinase [Leptolyngbyaceae cyanobacterium bins.349]
MDSSLADLTNFRDSNWRQTLLGKLCGTKQRFRDRYEILKILGRGGFGVTFLVRDVGLPGSPLCVIKQLCPKVSDPVALNRAKQRFEQEAKTLAKLGNHAQIPLLLDYFEADGEFYLIQEFVRGFTLAKEVRRQGPFSEAQVKQFLWEFLPLLQYIHSRHVIHRDIKPTNIIRCKDDGRLVLIDFGAVKETISQVDESGFRPSTTQFVGTVGFAPPEQLASRPVYSSDIYALGVTCLYLLSGRSPLEFDYEFVSGEVRWRDLIQVSDPFANVLSKMLKISPQDRCRSALDVINILQLEPYFQQLGDCLNDIRSRPYARPEEVMVSSESEAFTPHILKQAAQLGDCLNDIRSRPHAKPEDGMVGSESEAFTPRILKQAAQIREWQAKRKARQARQTRSHPRITFSNSGNWK